MMPGWGKMDAALIALIIFNMLRNYSFYTPNIFLKPFLDI